MKFLAKIVRPVLGRVILSLDAMTRPVPIQRDPAEQARVDAATRGFALYQYETCPFCVKVRRAIRRLNLTIELKDARNDPEAARELRDLGGQVQVPCLRTPTGWMYESADIVEFLEKSFPQAS